MIQIVRRDYVCELDMLFSTLNYFALYFSYFGFWDVKQDEEEVKRRGTRRAFQAETITPTALGIVVSSILYKERLLPAWNVASRRENGDKEGMPGSPLPEYHEYIEGKHHFRSSLSTLFPDEGHADGGRENRSAQAFFAPFVSLFPQGQLGKTLPETEGRKLKAAADGVYVVKVSLTGRSWRRIHLSSRHTFVDLHLAIQKAFEFNDDHLYSFFLDNKPWSKHRILSPKEREDSFFGSDGPFADEVQLRDAGLHIGKKFLYLFDYGDEWLFTILIEGIDEEAPLPLYPVVTEKKGEAPVQYEW